MYGHEVFYALDGALLDALLYVGGEHRSGDGLRQAGVSQLRVDYRTERAGKPTADVDD